MKSYQRRKKEVLVFRQFSGKGYALFSVLGREVRIGVLSVSTLMIAAPCLASTTLRRMTAFPSVTQADSLQLGEAVVSASRIPLAAEVAARQVTTLTRDELSAAGVTSVNDVLKLAAGLDVRQRGGFGIQTDISVDGGTFDEVSILIDGVPVNNPQTGHNAADFPLNLSDIRRIDIIQGASSRVFGAQAFSGVVNIITRSSGKPLSVSLQGGSHKTIFAEARSLSHWGKWSASVSGSYNRSDGAVKNGDFKGGKAFFQSRYAGDNLSFILQGGVSAKDFGANTFYTPRFNNQWEATRRYFVSAQGSSTGAIHLQPSVSFMRNVDHFQLFRNVHKYENFHRTDTYRGALNAWMQWTLGRTAAGAEIKEEEIFSSVLGQPMDSLSFFPVPGEKNAQYTHGDHRANISYYIEHTVLLRDWTISAGVMMQHNTYLGHQFRYYPGVDVSYRPAPNWKLYASWNKSLRLPTFTDLYYKSPAQEGNRRLKPEVCNGYRLGLNYGCRNFAFSLQGFYNHETNVLDWVKFDEKDKFHATNFNRLNNEGLTASLKFDLQEMFGEKQPFTRLSVNYAYMNQRRKITRKYYKSNYALEYLKNKFVAQLSHRVYKRLSADWTFRLQHRMGNYMVFKNQKSENALKPYGTYGILDGKLMWTEKRWQAFADFSNITNKRYYDLGNVEQPGFMLLIGCRWTL